MLVSTVSRPLRQPVSLFWQQKASALGLRPRKLDSLVALASKKKPANRAPVNLTPEVAPPPVDDAAGQAQQKTDPAVKPSAAAVPGATATAAVALEPRVSPLAIAYKKILKELSSLPRAIAIMALICVQSALGTIIPQNKAYQFYIDNFPIGSDNNPLGIISYEWILNLELDHIYTAWYFDASIALLAASLMACTSTRQWPAVRVAQNWRFAGTPARVVKMGKRSEVLPNARLGDLGRSLVKKGYQVFVQGPQLYAFKGLAGKLGPIGVHAALLLVLAGTSYSGFGGVKGTVMAPEGTDFVVSDYLRPLSPIARVPRSADNVMHVNKFTIDYRPDGQVAQFYSDLTLRDPYGAPLKTQTISVNKPFRYGGVTMYQTNWSLAALTLRAGAADAPPEALADAPPLSLPMASMEGRPGIVGALWATFLPTSVSQDDPSGTPAGISILARDPQSVVLYDKEGKFAGVRRPGSGKPITVDGVQIIVDEVIGSTGLEMKSDPGIPIVYAGFGALMITTLVSYLSHSQIWALQDGAYVYVSGKSSKQQFLFDQELDQVLDAVPEVASPPPAAQPQQQPSAAAATAVSAANGGAPTPQ